MNQRPTRSSFPVGAVLAALIVLSVGGYFAWQHFQPTQAAPEPSALGTGAPPASTPLPPVAAAPQAPAIEHPIDPPAPEPQAAALPALDEADSVVGDLLGELLGRTNVLGFLQVDGFVRRAVATVDNLPRSHAPVMVWPVNPTPQRFTTQRGADGSETIDPTNAQRYTPLVRMVEAVDTAQAVALYRRLYPLFQQAYKELGFPGRYFNDRLVQVLDHLIATPVQSGPLAVTLVEVKGEVPSLRPWVRYEFTDPALQSLSAGQKMLLRTGADNHQRLRAKLVEIRQQVARR